MCAPLFALRGRVTTVHLLLLKLGEVHEWETTRCGAEAKGDCGDTSLPTTRDPRKVTCKRCLASYQREPDLLCIV